MSEKRYTINQLAEKVNLSPCYIRRSIHKGNLQSELVPLDKNSKIMRHEITMTQFEEFRKSTKVRTSRTDGRSKMKWYLTDKEKEEVEKLLSENGYGKLVQLLEYANRKTN